MLISAKISLWAILLINIVLFILFVCGKYYVFNLNKWIKFVALYSVVVASFMFLNIVAIAIFTIISFYSGHILYGLAFPLFAVAPFWIGHFATFDKIRFYTNIQILSNFVAIILVAKIIQYSKAFIF